MSAKKSTPKKKEDFVKKADNLKKELKELKQDLKEKEEKLLRNYADFQNFQKRTEKQIQINEEEIKKKYLTELIEIYELLKQAHADKNPKPALKLMISNINNFLEKEQIKYIECLGKKFDHNLHHAVTTIDKDDCEENTIIEEIKKGYMLNEKLLRPSHVIVVKKEKNE